MRKIEQGTLAGLFVAVTAIALGLFMEGGQLSQVLQPTAAIIVLGGTCGAVLVHFSLPSVRAALRQFMDVLAATPSRRSLRTDQLLGYAAQARRNGIVSLDPELKAIEDPFFKKALMLVIDGMHVRDVREIMELESLRMEEENENAARVWEAAGGYAPTVGILGAVLGLIQVMQRLGDIGQIGRGIAVAFVATLYGVGLANLFLLPIAGKLRLRAREAQLLREITLEGVLAMAEGASPRSMRERLGVQGRERAPARVAQMAAR